MGIFLFDYSDDTSYDEHDPTIVPACLVPNIALVKSVGISDYLDLDNNGCVETIRYNFEVLNAGSTNLDNVVLNDNILGGPINGPLPLTDANSDGILSVGESWTYQANYSLTLQNVSDGEVTNQAEVTAYEEGTNNQVSALHEITTPLPINACAAEASIGLIKRTPIVALLDLDNDGCPETVDYQFTVTNTGSIDLGQINLIDTPLKAPITGPQNDIGGDGVLSVGESWTYEALYPITAQDELDGQVTNQAQVTAIALNDNSPISDLSDHTSNDEDRETVTVFNQTVCEASSSIGLLKRVPLGNLEDLDNDGCDETIRYFFDVENLGTITLENVELNDALFGGPITQYEALQGDDNNDQILSIGEKWTYEVLYSLSDQDITDTEVINQAQVTANEWGTSIEVTDDSDPSDYAQDRPTVTSTVGACPAEAGIGLIKTGVLVDSGNGCLNTIEYTFTVANTGTIDLDNVILTDAGLGGEITGLIQSTDTNTQGVLSANEEWTYVFQYDLTAQNIADTEVINQARVTAQEVISDNPIFDDSDHTDYDNDRPTITSTLGACTPAIQLTKAFDTFQDLVGNDNCNDAIRYTFTVENTGGFDLEGVVLSDDKIGGQVNTVPVSNMDNDQTLAVGEIWTYTADYPLVLNDINTGSVTNIADVEATDPINNVLVTDGDTINTILNGDECAPAPAIQLTKAFDSFQDLVGNDNCNDAIRYTFTVENTGDFDLEGVVLSDDKIGGQVNTVPVSNMDNDQTLAVGEIWTYTADYPLVLNDINTGSVTNIADVEATDPINNVLVTAGDTINTVLNGDECAPAPAIQLIKTVDSFQDLNGSGCNEIIRYNFTVENTGTVNLEGILLTDNKIAGQVNNPQGDVNTPGILSPGEIWTYQADYQLVQNDIDTGSVTNIADVAATEEGTNNNVSDQVQVVTDLNGNNACAPAAAIQLIKTVDSFQDLNGSGCNEIIRYNFTVENTGTVNLQDVVLTDDKIAGQVNNPQGDVNTPGILSPGEVWTYQADYQLVQNDIDTGSVTNIADVAATEEGTNNNVSDQVQVVTDLNGNNACAPAAAIQLIKTVDSFQDLNGSGCNEIIRYNFTVENTGTVNLEGILLTDDKIAGQVNNPQGDVNTPGILSPGEVWTYQADYQLVQNDIDTGSVTNIADVAATEEGTNNNVSDQVQVVTDLNGNNACAPTDAIQLIKTLIGPGWEDTNNDGCFERLVYTFMVENTGISSLVNVVLNDPDLGGEITVQPQGDVNNDEVLSVGEQWVYEVPYLITQADMDFGSVSNQANVTADVENTNNSVTDMDEITLQLDNNFCAAAGIELTKVGVLEDLDGNNCPESIQYTFTVTNTGVVDLTQIVLTDTDLTVPINGPMNDSSNDQTLSSGESWIYEAIYPITQADIDNVTITNQASVTAIESETNTTIGDSSDVVNTNVSGACIAEASIGLIKTAGNELVDVDRDGCPENISYTFTVKNTGAIILQDVVLNDIKLGPGSIEGPLPGNDINGDTFLSVGETWTYQALYPISEQDSIAGQVINRAQVSAVELGTTIAVTDDSDNNSFDEDDDTITSIAGACVARAGIELLKTGVLVDQDGDGCAESIQYSFTVENTGAINLYQILLEDPLLEQTDILGPLPGSDSNGDQVISVDETWMFEALYSITQQNIADGEVTNQATVSALEVLTNNPITSSDEIVMTVVNTCINPDSDFKIFNGISPNGDGVNDYFQIDGIENYPDNTLKVFNRWGVLVFEVDGYGLSNKQFTGHSDSEVTVAKDRKLPSGTYFYTLTFHGNNNPGKESYTGYLYINQD
nr:gliding motility-associated C-terminal domain-containing protein [Muricauda sp. CAU 1633]